MRHEIGLDLPERRIGLSAHDFAQMMGADEVILSHAAKVGGAPAVASRFLHRLKRWRARNAGMPPATPAKTICASPRSSTARQGRAYQAAGAKTAARGPAASSR